MTAVIPDVDAPVPSVDELGPVHLIGIGGAGMSGVARLLLARGVTVSGSDAKAGPVLDGLAAAGATVHTGHDASQVPATGSVVVSSAVRDDNPELVEARRRGLRVLHRSQALAALMQGHRSVAVAGTHGKTTTTGLLTVLLREAGLDPSFAIGGELTDSRLGAADGAGDVFVAEADESDGSFLLYRPLIGVVTNIEPDHLDHYGTAEAVEDAFVQFCARVRPGGAVVACGDDAGVRSVLLPLREELQRGGVALVLYGTGPDNDLRLDGLTEAGEGSTLTLVDGDVRTPVRVAVPGAHNALNAAAAFATARILGVLPDRAAAGIAAFHGTRRRFETRGVAGGVRVVDDYAHHPTEVAAVLRAARSAAAGGRVVALFQPHLFSRTRIFARDFGVALAAADEVVVLDVYAAREDPEPGVTGALVADAVDLPGHVYFEPDQQDAVVRAAGLARAGDLVLTIGAGDVSALGPDILDRLGSR